MQRTTCHGLPRFLGLLSRFETAHHTRQLLSRLSVFGPHNGLPLHRTRQLLELPLARLQCKGVLCSLAATTNRTTTHSEHLADGRYLYLNYKWWIECS
jgi:hypothetical protein